MGAAHYCSKVVSMVIDVGHLHDDGLNWMLAAKVAVQGQDKSDCSHPDRKSKRSTPRRGVVEKGAISQAKLLLGWRREKYHSNNSTAITAAGTRGEEGWRQQEGGGRSQTKNSIMKVIKHVCSHKQTVTSYYPDGMQSSPPA